MNFEKEVDPYNVDTLLTLSEYCTFQNRFLAEANEELDTKMEEIAEEIATEALDGRKYNIYSDKEKAIFYALGYQKTTTTTMDFRPFFFFSKEDILLICVKMLRTITDTLLMKRPRASK